jgi:hypothetical protein
MDKEGVIFLSIVAFCLFSAKGCGSASQAQEDLPYGMTCNPSPMDGTPARRCENAEAVCYILTDSSLSCYPKGGAQ